jgi:betaine-aldehyde dehydrogenase
VASAREAFATVRWSAPERGAALQRIADELEARLDELTTLSTAETGVPISTSPALQRVALKVLRDYAEMRVPFESRTPRARILREPVGVALGIAPWNAPVAGLSFMLGPALAAGCPIVLKPAHEAPLATYVLADAVAAADLPQGMVSILPGDASLGEHLVRHPGIDKISFTGSTVAGRRIGALAAERIARVTLELGGKSPAIVADDADLDAVVGALVAGGAGNSGQVCCALTRVLVSERRHDELVERLAVALEALQVGDPMDPATDVGPLALERQRERVEGYIALGREQGARVVTGGGRPADLRHGWFVEPTLFDRVEPSMRIAREEIFGPVISVLAYRDLDDAVALANDSDYGLLCSVFTRGDDVAERLARGVRAGQVHINGYGTCTGEPFGGFKQSGIGRKGGAEGLDAFLETKVIERHGGRP